MSRMDIWFVCRQCYWGLDEEDANVVEIAQGGVQYSNADMLAVRYKTLGEGQEYSDPREALKAAYAVREAWAKDAPKSNVHVEMGFTGGLTMPFVEHPTDEQLNSWAEAAWLALPRCDHCGAVIRERFVNEVSEDVYCSEYCAEQAEAEILENAESIAEGRGECD